MTNSEMFTARWAESFTELPLASSFGLWYALDNRHFELCDVSESAILFEITACSPSISSPSEIPIRVRRCTPKACPDVPR